MKIVFGFFVLCIFAAIQISDAKISRMHYLIFAKAKGMAIKEQADKILSQSENKNVTNIENLSYFVSVRRDGKHVCQGSIIDADHILLPAYCVECNSTSYSKFTVLAGTNHINDDTSGVLYEVSDITCNVLNSNAGVALLTLSKNITTNQRTIGVELSQNITDDNEINNKNLEKSVNKNKNNNFMKTRYVYWNISETNIAKINKIETRLSLSYNCYTDHGLKSKDYICPGVKEFNICKNNNDAVLISNEKIIGMPTKIGCNKKNRKTNVFIRMSSLIWNSNNE